MKEELPLNEFKKLPVEEQRDRVPMRTFTCPECGCILPVANVRCKCGLLFQKRRGFLFARTSKGTWQIPI